MLESCVYARLPRAGLGNKMLVWARALVFSEVNSLPLFVSGWAEFKLGPYLRREKIKRQYWGYFPSSSAPGLLMKVLFSLFYEKIREPKIEKRLSLLISNRSVLVFDTTPSWEDYFAGLRGHEDLIRQKLLSNLAPQYQAILDQQPTPIIGVHIRCSDFRELQPGELPGGVCNTRTPIDDYILMVERVREIAGELLPVTVFTDGSDEEVRGLLDLPNVDMARPNPDVVDLILLSYSKCIIVSAGSTFSYWAAFLSEAAVVTHPGHPVRIRSDSLRSRFFEGSLQDLSLDYPMQIQLVARNFGDCNEKNCQQPSIP